MWIPKAFRIDDPAKISALMQRYSFAVIVTADGDSAPIATHLPVLLDADRGPFGTVVSHMARENPQWKHFESGRETLAVFNGPHAYITPAWYQPQVTVPTWNYAAVHAYGIPRIIADRDRVIEILERTIRTYEEPLGNPWTATIPTEYRDRLMKDIVAFEIELTRVEAQFKLSQNRSDADFRGVYEALNASADSVDRELAGLMRAEWPSAFEQAP